MVELRGNSMFLQIEHVATCEASKVLDNKQASISSQSAMFLFYDPQRSMPLRFSANLDRDPD